MTSTRHRSFTTSVKDPVSFDIDGEEFNCVGDLPAGVLLDVASAVSSDGTLVDPAILTEFFEAVIAPDDRERFAKRLRSEGGPGLSDLKDIMQFLVEEYAGFPTRTSSGSRRQPAKTGPGSEGSSRSHGSTSKTSQRRKR